MNFFDQPVKSKADELFGYRSETILNATLKEARDSLALKMDEGSRCLCCNRRAQLYKVSLHKGMVMALGLIVKAYLTDRVKWGEFLHVEDYLVEVGSTIKGVHGKLAHWNMLETMPNEDPAKNKSGLWRVTDTGVSFIKNEIAVPQKALLYNDECFGFEGKLIRAKDVVHNFDYSELMGWKN